MKNKIILGALALMIAAGGLVGCNAMKEGVEEVMPSASAPAAAGTATAKPSAPAENGSGMNATASPTASAAASASPDAGVATE